MIHWLKYFPTYLLIFGVFFPQFTFSQFFITGKITDINKRNLVGVNVYSDKVNNGTFSDSEGNFLLEIREKGTSTVFFSHVGYEKISREISGVTRGDTLEMNIVLMISPAILQPFTVNAHPKPDTVFASVEFNVSDFEFMKEKILVLAYKTKPEKDAELLLTDENSTVFFRMEIEPGPRELFKDFEGNVNLVYKDTVFRISLIRNEISIMPLNFSDFSKLIKPCIDTVGERIIFSDFTPDYPEFNYYYFSPKKREISPFKNISDKPLMREFRYEYYFLPSKEKLKARQFAMEYHIDKHVVAAAMTGFQKSFYYTPLYAPLFVINDSILIFDHYENTLYFFNQYTEPIDSVGINYHNSTKDKWERRIVKDAVKDNIYALFRKNGFYYLKRINLRTGRTDSSFKLYHKYVENIKINNGYVYYIFRPFESLQKKFLYKELILSE